MTRRRWIADEWDDRSASLKGEQAAHLIRVLRAQAGMKYDIVAGDRVWRAVISGVSGDSVRFTLLSEVEAEAALPVTILLSIFKFDRMEWIIEKATELGAERFVPMTARRSEKHLAQAAPARVERWRRVAREAAKQSRRSDVPLVEDVVTLKAGVRIKAAPPGLSLLLAEQERSTTLSAAMQQDGIGRVPVHLALGPEGGWTAEEEALFASEGWQAVSLGPRILRAETAGIAAMAVVAAMLGGSSGLDSAGENQESASEV
jgi:16S rRNA (uracil1498-N3)-methyltransferase